MEPLQLRPVLYEFGILGRGKRFKIKSKEVNFTLDYTQETNCCMKIQEQERSDKLVDTQQPHLHLHQSPGTRSFSGPELSFYAKALVLMVVLFWQLS